MANTAVINASTQAFPPLLDRFFVAELPSAQLAAGRFPDIPFISGNNLDEGTLFAPRTITNDTGLGASLVLQYGEGMRSLVPELLKLYPQDPAAGSPFRSELQGVPADDRFFGPENQYKRAASILGDLVFQATRRSQLSAAVKKNKSPVWSYLFSQPSPGTNATTSLGVYHSSEILYVYAHPPAADAASDAAYAAGQTDTLNATQIANAKYAGAKDIEVTSKHMSSAWIHFANSLSPNGADAPHWPSYGKEEKMIQFQGSYNTTIIKDDYRKAATDYLNANAAKIHL